ncbi:MAG: hypothetical protein IJS93_02535 [Clostridia bacterium]|nr:hypothetical protein [Clostridia bacterium]
MDGFVKWFNGLSKIVRCILLIIPFVGWLFEVILRLAVVLKKATALNIIVFLVYLFVGWAWILNWIDVICILLNDKQFLM